MRKDFIRKYGIIPAPPKHLTARTVKIIPDLSGGDASIRHAELICKYEESCVSFPIKVAEAVGKSYAPTVILISPISEVPSKYLPAEELVSRGVRVIQIFADDILASARKEGSVRSLLSGKRLVGAMSLLAYAVMRAAEYAFSFGSGEHTKIAAMAHGQFCEAALLAAICSDKITHALLSSPMTDTDGSLYVKSASMLTGEEAVELFLSLADECSKKILISSARYENEKIESYPRASLFLRGGYPTLSREDWDFFIDALSNN